MWYKDTIAPFWSTNKFLCIIPARGGSKEIKDKNIQIVGGKPLIAWAIKAAKDSGIFREIVVSTDSNEIGEVVISYGADDVWWRPEGLSQDTSHVMDAICWHLHHFKHDYTNYDYVQLHHATSPLVTGFDIRKAASFMLHKNADFVISMCPSDVPLGIAKPIPEDGCVKGWSPKELRQLNRQEIQQPYQLDGNIYIGKWDIFYNNIDYWDTNIYAYKMSREKYLDINDESDIKLADSLFRGRSWLDKIRSMQPTRR